MTIKEFINQEVEHAKNVIKEELEENRIEDLNEFLEQTNEMLDEIIYTHIRDSVKFDVVDSLTGNYYKSMLGNGKQIDYSDLYEILNRLYKYHHESLEYSINFEEYSVTVNYDILTDNPSNNQIFRILMVAFGNGEYLQVSDF